MWKKQDNAALGAQPDFASKQTPDLASLGDALVQRIVNDQFEKGNSAVSEKVLAEDHSPRLPSPSMNTYTEAVNEFTKNATAFIAQLPLLTRARVAYEEAMRASAEMRKVLDAGEEKLRTLMTQVGGARGQRLRRQARGRQEKPGTGESRKDERDRRRRRSCD